MADSFETVVKNFSGLSTETKPTIAAGNNVPNGSRWREVDTGITFFFNLADDDWYPYLPQRVVRLDYSGSDMIYRGINTTHKAATSATNWVIWKYTYVSSILTKIEGPLVGTWDGRPALDWS